MMQCKSSRDGFALSIVLWIVAAMLFGIAFIVSLSRDNLKLTKELDDKLQARLKAESLLEVLKFAILTSDYDNRSLIVTKTLPYNLPSKIILDGRVYSISKDINISLRDASSMLNVINPNAQMLASLMTNSSERELFYTIRDSVRDWVDEDDVVRLNGAEESFYRLKKGVKYGPRNSPAIQSIDELRLINGIDRLDEKRWSDIKRYIYYGDGAQVNLALIDPLYLSKLLKLNFLEADTLDGYRKTDFDKFLKTIRQNENYDDDYMGFALSFKIKIDIMVRNSKSISKLHTLVNFRSLSSSSMSVDRFEIW